MKFMMFTYWLFFCFLWFFLFTEDGISTLFFCLHDDFDLITFDEISLDFDLVIFFLVVTDFFKDVEDVIDNEPVVFGDNFGDSCNFGDSFGDSFGDFDSVIISVFDENMVVVVDNDDDSVVGDSDDEVDRDFAFISAVATDATDAVVVDIAVEATFIDGAENALGSVDSILASDSFTISIFFVVVDVEFIIADVAVLIVEIIFTFLDVADDGNDDGNDDDIGIVAGPPSLEVVAIFDAGIVTVGEYNNCDGCWWKCCWSLL